MIKNRNCLFLLSALLIAFQASTAQENWEELDKLIEAA
jgi:hypothetical protein